MVHMYMAGLNLCFLSNAHGHPKMYVLSRPRVQRGSYQTFQVTTGQLHMKKVKVFSLLNKHFLTYSVCSQNRHTQHHAEWGVLRR